MKIRNFYNDYLDSFLELIYPEKNHCVICNIHDESIGEEYICESCRRKLNYINDPICTKCGKDMLFESENEICNQCCKHNYSFIKNKSVFKYDGIIKKIIHDYKYLDKSYYYKFLSTTLYHYMIDNYYLNFDIITCVPIHKHKLKERGYNQTELLAKFISHKLDIPYSLLLVRKADTIKQSNLSKKQREKNLLNAFAICEKIDYNIVRDKSILIIDDIYTTGSTMEACAKVLIENGAAAVYGLTVAR